MWNIPRTKKVERSRSEGNFARKYRTNGPRNQAKRYGHITVPSKQIHVLKKSLIKSVMFYFKRRNAKKLIAL
jgi:hypothetical protein